MTMRLSKARPDDKTRVTSGTPRLASLPTIAHSGVPPALVVLGQAEEGTRNAAVDPTIVSAELLDPSLCLYCPFSVVQFFQLSGRTFNSRKSLKHNNGR